MLLIFELPNIPEDYIHRIGRTARAGTEGSALSLVSAEENDYLRDIEKLVRLKIPSKIKIGFEPDPNAIPEPQKQKSRTKHKPRNPNKGYRKRDSRR